MGSLAGLGEASAGGEVVLERVEKHGADLKAVVLAVDFFENEKLVVVLRRLCVVDAYARDVLSLGDKGDIVDFSLKHLLPVRIGRGKEHG